MLHTYDQKPFKLDGRMEQEVEFGDTTIKTVVYIKMDAQDQLLLSEGVIEKCSGFKQTWAALGTITEIKVIIHVTMQEGRARVNQQVSNVNVQWRKDKLCTLVDKGKSALAPSEWEQLKVMLGNSHNVFSLEENERGEPDLIQFKINTGDSAPTKQPTRHIPQATHQEIACLLKAMQEANVTKPYGQVW